jgi:hypothetical protein
MISEKNDCFTGFSSRSTRAILPWRRGSRG